MHESPQPTPDHVSDNSSRPASIASKYTPQCFFLASTLHQDHSKKHHKRPGMAMIRLVVSGSELWSTCASTLQMLPDKPVTKCTACLCTTTPSWAFLSWRNSRQTSCNIWQVRENSSAA